MGLKRGEYDDKTPNDEKVKKVRQVTGLPTIQHAYITDFL
jgi:hypothetical protein